MADMNDDELLDALGVEAEPFKISRHTAWEERIIAGFDDILRFYLLHGRVPSHGEDRDIFERIYAVRLEQLSNLPEARALLSSFDAHGLLVGAVTRSSTDAEALDQDALLAALGVGDEYYGNSENITVLQHVRPYAEIKAAEEIANRKPCKDFEKFKPLFEQSREGLIARTWMTKPFAKDASIELGDFFIVGGQIAYIAEMHSGNLTKDGRNNPRMRVIFDNGTESDLLLRSLSRSLYPDGNTPVGQRLIRKDDGPLFNETQDTDDIESGTIYVLRSLSSHPYIAEHRQLIHKIGMTNGKVPTRVAAARTDSTYLLADVEIVAEYKLHNLSRNKLEKILHRLFGAVQLDLTIEDRFGNPVKPKEWFLVPLHVIDEAVKRIQNGSITDIVYDLPTASLVEKQ